MARNAKSTKKLTLRYWKSLDRGSRERALQFCFPTQRPIVDMLLDESPNTEEIKNGLWSIVFSHIREALPDSTGRRHYKTVHLNKTWIP